MFSSAIRFLILAPLAAIALPSPSKDTTAVVTKRFTTTDNASYVYDYVPAQADSHKPTLLLLHGFPSYRDHWKHQVADLSAAGFGVLAPDLQGFGDSDLPTAVEAQNLRRIAGHLTEILDAESLDTVIGVGHDWGANVLSRAYAWHPDRFGKLAFLSVGYTPAGIFLDIDAFNVQGQQAYGYMQFGYWYFFNSYDAAEVMAAHLESTFSLVFPPNASTWAEHLGPIGAARAWVNANTTTELPGWLCEEDKARWIRQYSRPNALDASLNMYRSLMRGVQAADEAGLTDEDRTIKVPVLALGSGEDPVARSDQMTPTTEPWAKAGYRFVEVDAGHWLMLEQKDEVSRLLIEFASET